MKKESSDDHVNNYARQVIQMGLMLMNLNDTEKEGDGRRMVINWKILLLYFRSCKWGRNMLMRPCDFYHM